MSSSRSAMRHYGQMNTAGKSAREIEFGVLSKITQNLRQSDESKTSDRSSFVKALETNRSFWSLWAAELKSPDHSFPDQLRADLLSLGAFIKNHTDGVIKGTDNIEPILEINTSILNGLASRK